MSQHMKATVMDAARCVEASKRQWGKVWISDVHASLVDQGWRISLESFKAALANDTDVRGLMSRCDLTQAISRPDALLASETMLYLGDDHLTASWHFVRID